MATFIYQNGEHVKDVVTGFAGHIMGRSDYLTGCNQYLLQPSLESKEKWQSGNWFDESRLERTKTKAIKINMPSDKGADIPAPMK